MSAFQQWKLWLVQLAGLPKDALHIYAGLAVFLLTALLLRRPLKSRLPILAVIVAALAGEAWDMLDTHAAGRAIVWPSHWHDLWNTSLAPVILFLLARYTGLFAPRRR